MKRFLPSLTFLTVAVVGLTMAGFVYHERQESNRIRFQAIADSAYNRIESRVELHFSVLRATHALFMARNGNVSSIEFREYFEALGVSQNFAGLRGIGYLKLAQPGDDEKISRLILAEHGIERQIYPQSSEGLRTPIILYEPLGEVQLEAIGYDMLSEPSRRAAIMAALAEPGPHLTGRVLLGRQTDNAQTFPGFLIFTRLDSGTEDTQSQADGFLFANFRANELFQIALQRMPLLPVAIEIYDEQVDPDRLLFRSTTPPANTSGGGMTILRTMQIGDRNWLVQFRPTSTFSSTILRPDLLMLIVFSLLLALAMAMAIRYRERAYASAASLHQATEISLMEKDLMLQEMKHRNKNLISRILAISRQTASGCETIDEFSNSFSARLQAMSTSLDMLTRSSWQKAELGELLRNELYQVFGKDLQEDLLSGPEVHLDETATQALGLTFHELATNALKYSAPDGGVNGLRIHWRTESQKGKQHLILNWRESGHENLVKPKDIGFGTRLIDLNVIRELNGSIERRFHPTGLEVEIRIPLSR